ncbi:2-oxo acid dehydrogenase subunit E2 [Amycolatopsis sp. OK19-0408]|uniref:Dihydrolipoamide acetyltransferase component of pyruvate dehydrogenase complex n=1 Tax=Amycolatopsis iheyensis TaxID=2945988 RepID=A0A9X2NEF4_9PSEU|nr:dihydrolipoamide acetyltransferase family protein [Amycolatopsis iheyensis]MCR6485751.1 2-oxo acid dehydrogenase subunit E2 [Amycolatopsis iheyensis]
MPDFLLPDLGEGLTEAAILNWHVGVGDTVAVDQVVVEVETAKASVEVPVPFAGVVSALHGEPGQLLPVGSPLLSVGGFAEPGVTTSAGSGNVLIGYGTAPTTRRKRVRRVETPAPKTKTPGVISPFVRKLASDNGIDLTKVTPTGADGIIRRADVEAMLRKKPAANGKRIPLTGVRKAVADKLTTSRREIPEATVWVDVDASELVAARVALNARSDRPVSLLGLIARFAVAGLKKYPELNSRVEGDEIVLLDEIHLGFAAQTDRGLVVPVVRDAGDMSTRDLSAAIGDRAKTARDGKLAPADLTGGTFTVNNYGVFGVDGSAAIINHPEAAILGIGRIIDRPWVVDGTLGVRKVCELTLAFDHRVCDGGTAGGFLRFVADCVESPVTALGDL